MSIVVKPTERCDFFGKTGSGKTTLARALLRSTDYPFVVLDPKWRYTDGDVKIVHDFRPELEQQIIRVPPSHDDLERWDDIIFRVWDRGDAILYIDEVTLILPGSRSILPWHRRAIVTGRERGMGVWNGTQRPSEIGSSVIFTETEHFFLFRLQFEADRVKASSFTSDRVGRAYKALQRGGAAAKHDFIYYNPDADRLIRFHSTRLPK